MPRILGSIAAALVALNVSNLLWLSTLSTALG